MSQELSMITFKKLKVGYQTYDIKACGDLADRGEMGVTYKNRQLIEYSPNLQPRELADTLIHEILHCICHSYIPDVQRADEEEVVTMLAHGLTQVLRDNPKVFPEISKLL